MSGGQAERDCPPPRSRRREWRAPQAPPSQTASQRTLVTVQSGRDKLRPFQRDDCGRVRAGRHRSDGPGNCHCVGRLRAEQSRTGRLGAHCGAREHWRFGGQGARCWRRVPPRRQRDDRCFAAATLIPDRCLTGGAERTRQAAATGARIEADVHQCPPAPCTNAHGAIFHATLRKAGWKIPSPGREMKPSELSPVFCRDNFRADRHYYLRCDPRPGPVPRG